MLEAKMNHILERQRSTSTSSSRSRSKSKHRGTNGGRGRSPDDRRSDSLKRSSRNRRSSYSRSKSRSFTPSKHRRRSPSRSPFDDRRGGGSIRDRPQECRCLGIFGLNITTSEKYIREIFSKYGPIDRVQLVIDAKSGRSRGFCFVYYMCTADAKTAKEGCNGLEIDGRRIRVDYSITQRPHTPTPGVYMGRPTQTYKHDRYRDDHRRRRSPSPYRDRRRRYDRSRSRSYSPRRTRY